jgi:small-conductance mechanosensitive channel
MNLTLANSYLSNSFTNQIIDGVDHLLPRLPIALFDLLVGILVIRILSHVIHLALKLGNVQPGLRQVITSILETIMWLLLTVALLQELGFSGIIYFFTGSVFAIGLALSAGGSTLVSDIVAGLFLARDADFNVGDELIVGEPAVQGVVIAMDSRRIRLRDDKGVLHVVPNSVVERKEWVVIHSRRELPALVKATKAAKRLGAAARKKGATVARKRSSLSKNDQ